MPMITASEKLRMILVPMATAVSLSAGVEDVLDGAVVSGVPPYS